MQSLNNINHMNQPRALRRGKGSLSRIPAAQEFTPNSQSIRLPYTFASPDYSSVAVQAAVNPASTPQLSGTSPNLAYLELPSTDPRPIQALSTPEQNPTREHKDPTLPGHRHAILIDGWVRSPEMTATRLGMNILSKAPRYRMLRSIRSQAKMLTKLCKPKKPAVALTAPKKLFVISTPSNPLHTNSSSGANTAMIRRPALPVKDTAEGHGINFVFTPPSDSQPHPKPLRSNPVSKSRHFNDSRAHAAKIPGHLTVDHCWEVLYKREHRQSWKRISDLTANLSHEKEASLYWEESFVKLHREGSSRDVLIRTQSSKNQIRTLENEKKHLETENIALNTQLVQALALAEHWKMLFQQQERIAEALQRLYGIDKTPVAPEDSVEEGELSHENVEPPTLEVPQLESEHGQPVFVEPSRADDTSPTFREADENVPELSAIAFRELARRTNAAACEPQELQAKPAGPAKLHEREHESPEPVDFAPKEAIHELADQDRIKIIHWHNPTEPQQPRPESTDLGNNEPPSQPTDWSSECSSDSDSHEGPSEEEGVDTATYVPSHSLPLSSLSQPFPCTSLSPIPPPRVSQPRPTKLIFNITPRRIEPVPAVCRIPIDSGREVQVDAWASMAMNTWEWCSVPSLALELINTCENFDGK